MSNSTTNGSHATDASASVNAAAMQALGTAARAYTSSLGPSGAGAFAPGTGAVGQIDFASLSALGLPPATIALVAAAISKQAAPQQHHHHQAHAPPVLPSNIASAFGHLQQQHQQGTPNPAAAQALIAAALANSMQAPPAHGSVVSMNHISALLQSVASGGGNLASSTVVTPPVPPTSYSSAPSTTFHHHHARHAHRAVNDMASTTNSLAASAPQIGHTATTPTPTGALVPNIQHWSVQQLENHIKLLQQMNQSVPHSVALLLADARRKADKKKAKRVANRKSACTSRARKKALVEEMTRTNARLRRQALILSLLPDLVIVISPEGEITFCSAQVERTLKHNLDDLVGADIRDLLIPQSRIALGKLVTGLMNPGKSSAGGSKAPDSGDQPCAGAAADKAQNAENDQGDDSAGSGTNTSSGAVLISDQAFPLSVVKVDSGKQASDENENSDASGAGVAKEAAISSVSNNSAMRSPSASLANSGSGSDDSSKPTTKKEAGAKKERSSPTTTPKGTRLSSSDDSSSGSTETGNINKANENLERNVRWHNKKLKASRAGHKDDVLGDPVTANNALARLSSLQHVPSKKRRYETLADHSLSATLLSGGMDGKKKTDSENLSDDSGYRESNDSREETSSCASESSNSNGRIKPLAPTCNVCLIRDDLTTLWCEVTSSIRTKREPDEKPTESMATASASGGSKTETRESSDETAVDNEKAKPKTKELLLCLRPIRDGEPVDPSLKFVREREAESIMMLANALSMEIAPVVHNTMIATESLTSSIKADVVHAVSNIDSASGASGGGSVNTSISEDQATREPQRGPSKKRNLSVHGTVSSDGSSSKHQRVDGTPKKAASVAADTEKSVVESLILMSNKPSN